MYLLDCGFSRKELSEKYFISGYEAIIAEKGIHFFG